MFDRYAIETEAVGNRMPGCGCRLRQTRCCERVANSARQR